MMEKRMLSAFAPSIPIWAMLYNIYDDLLEFRPVVAIALVQIEDEYGVSTRLEPQVLWRDDLKSFGPNDHEFLGYALEGEKVREKWESRVEDYKRYYEGNNP